MPKNKPKRIGFYCELPAATIKEIRRRSSATKPQWKVIAEAMNPSAFNVSVTDFPATSRSTNKELLVVTKISNRKMTVRRNKK